MVRSRSEGSSARGLGGTSQRRWSSPEQWQWQLGEVEESEFVGYRAKEDECRTEEDAGVWGGQQRQQQQQQLLDKKHRGEEDERDEAEAEALEEMGKRGGGKEGGACGAGEGERDGEEAEDIAAEETGEAGAVAAAEADAEEEGAAAGVVRDEARVSNGMDGCGVEAAGWGNAERPLGESEPLGEGLAWRILEAQHRAANREAVAAGSFGKTFVRSAARHLEQQGALQKPGCDEGDAHEPTTEDPQRGAGEQLDLDDVLKKFKAELLQKLLELPPGGGRHQLQGRRREGC